MNIISVCAFSILAVVLALFLKNNNPIFSLILIVASGILLLIFVLSDISYLLEEIKSLINKSGINNNYLTVALKALGICYLTQFTSEICKDFGQNSIASKVELAGKLMVVTLTLPLIQGIIKIAMELLKWRK